MRRLVTTAVAAALLAAPAVAVAPASAAYAADPPAAPASLRAVAGDDGIGVAWPAVTGATEYRLYRDGATTPVYSGAAVTYVDPGSAGTTHAYAVTAVNAGGESTATASAGATVPSNVTDAGTHTGFAGESPTRDYASGTLTPSGTPATLTFYSGAGGVSVRPADGSAWTPGAMTATVGGDVICKNTPVTATLDVTEARVHANGRPVAVRFTADLPCPSGTEHLVLGYQAAVGWIGPDIGEDSHTFPPKAPGTTSDPWGFVVHNWGSEDLVLGTATLPAGFVVSADTCAGSTVHSGGYCQFSVAAAPTAIGPYSGTLVLPDNTAGGARRVALQGDGGGPPGAVTGLVANPFVDRAMLTWKAPAALDPATHPYYLVDMSLTATGPWTNVGQSTTPRLGWAANMHIAGARRYFRVRPKSDFGSGPSTTTSVVFPGSELQYVADTGSGVYHTYRLGPAGVPVLVRHVASDEEDPFATGNLLYYTRMNEGRLHVFRAGLNGTPEYLYLGDKGTTQWEYRNPRVSPDGVWLAVACRVVTQSYYDLCVSKIDNYNPSQSQRIVIPAVRSTGGYWAPDSSLLYVVAATATSPVQVVTRDGAYRRSLPGMSNARSAAVSPDGQRLAWTRYEGAYAATGAPRVSLRVSPLSGGAGIALQPGGYANDPDWSADGSRVYYTHTPDPASPWRDIYWSPATGGTAHQVTNTPTTDEDNVFVNDFTTYRAPAFVPRPLGDFNGNGIADVAVFRPGTGEWRAAGQPTVTWGRLGDIPVAADYNGDGRTDRAVYRPSDHTWRVYGHAPVTYGAAGDVPAPADYNGDGKADFAVYRPATGVWYIYQQRSVPFGGGHGAIPVPADYNGDHRADIAVVRPTGNGLAWSVAIGQRWDPGYVYLPAPGDYLVRGRAEMAGYGEGYFNTSTVGLAEATPIPGDVPVAGHFVGDRRADPGLYNALLGLWRVVDKANVTFGIPGDIPV